VSTHPRMRMVVPAFLPYGPMTLQFPNDYALYNFTLISSTPISTINSALLSTRFR